VAWELVELHSGSASRAARCRQCCHDPESESPNDPQTTGCRVVRRPTGEVALDSPIAGRSRQPRAPRPRRERTLGTPRRVSSTTRRGSEHLLTRGDAHARLVSGKPRGSRAVQRPDVDGTVRVAGGPESADGRQAPSWRGSLTERPRLTGRAPACRGRGVRPRPRRRRRGRRAGWRSRSRRSCRGRCCRRHPDRARRRRCRACPARRRGRLR
jgi:hypothetical protein